MNKSVYSIVKAIAVAFILVTLVSCKKECQTEIKKRPFKLRTETWYRISPTALVPLTIKGINYEGYAHFPGGGSGNATHIGQVTIYFNQLAYRPTSEAPPAGSVAAPVKDILSYPSGGPLPLIQPADFLELQQADQRLNIPANVQGNIVNTVVYNKNGDAIFLSAITGGGSTFPVSATVVGFDGKARIVGGRGRFTHAIGEVDFNGEFNISNANDARFDADGWIDY